ncbi:hypothetical protein ES705_14079 [subsurface metagenome]
MRDLIIKVYLLSILFFSVLVLSLSPVSAQSNGIHNVTDYGGIGDGRTLNTKAIQQAINACSAKGGGTVHFPAGVYVSGTIYMRDNITLNLEAGAKIIGSTSVKDYPLNNCKVASFTDSYTGRALIWGEDLHNIAITGRGTIDGQGADFLDKLPSKEEWEKQIQFFKDSTRFVPDLPHINRPFLIRFISCSNVLVEGVTLQNSVKWMQHYLNCEFLTVRDINVFNHASANNDMIDIDGCRNVVITGCYGDTEDDALTLKSTGSMPTENVVISNCVLRTRTNAIKAGTESSGGFKNITITNCVIQPSSLGNGVSAIALIIVDGGVLDGVTISNITIEDYAAPIYLRLGNRARKYRHNLETPPVGVFQNVKISNIIASNAGNMGCSILGLKDHPIKNVSINNVKINFDGGGTQKHAEKEIPEDVDGYPQGNRFGNMPAYGFFVRHAEGITFRDIDFDYNTPEKRTALLCDDVKRLKIYNLHAEVLPSIPQVTLRNTKEVFISECYPPEADVFLKVEKNSEQVSLLGNNFNRIDKPIVLDESIQLSELQYRGNLPDKSLFATLQPFVQRGKFGLVIISSFTTNSDIYYTLDGTEPTTSSEKYTAPFEHIGQVLLKARVSKNEEMSGTAVVNFDKAQVLKPQIEPSNAYFNKPLKVELSCAYPKAEIRYTLDGSEPSGNSPLYKRPVIIEKSDTLRAKAFKNGYKPSPEAVSRYERVPFVDGVQYKYYEGLWHNIPDFFELSANNTGTVKDFSLDGINSNNKNWAYASLMIGFINIEKSGNYTFYCSSNDDSELYVDSKLLIHDVFFGFQELKKEIYLEKGIHQIEVRYLQRGGHEFYKISLEGDGLDRQELNWENLSNHIKY